MGKRQITIKPTFMSELRAYPGHLVALLWDKIDALLSDPVPDGKVKLKLKGGDGICRMRIGEYRLFYSFTDEWLSLLGIRRRREDTYNGLPVATDGSDNPPKTERELDVVLAAGVQRTFHFAAVKQKDRLPFAITEQWLGELAVPKGYWHSLMACKSEDELIALSIPQDMLALVLDAMFPPSIQQVIKQADFIVPTKEHLVKFKNGDLLAFLLKLDDEQRQLTKWALKGPTMICGGAGTGKSTVALYRAKEMLERPGATGVERLLFATYTRALLAVTQQLLAQLLTPAQLKRVTVTTCDGLAFDIVKAKRSVGPIELDRDTAIRLAALRKSYKPASSSAVESRLRARALARLSDQYLLEEFDWIIMGRDLQSLEEYLLAPRPGRGVALNDRARSAVWDLFQAFHATGSAAKSQRIERFADLRVEALKLASEPRSKPKWDYVFVDEAQDLSPTALSLMAEVCESAEGLFFAADNKQSLYSRNYRWASAHPRLQFRGRTMNLARNYRSTAEIDRAAFAVLKPEEGEAMQRSASVHEGPMPVLVTDVRPGTEAAWIVRFVREIAAYLHLRTSASAVLVPTRATGEHLANELSSQEMPAKFFAGKDLDLHADVVKVLTLHSSKGLEFPIVVVCGFDEGSYPVPEDFDAPEVFDERMRHERRLLYVGFTRAMRGLMVLVPQGCRHQALTELATGEWHVEKAES